MSAPAELFSDAAMAHHERARIVYQHFLRYAAEGRERALEPGNQCSCFSVRNPQPPRMPERRHEHKCLDLRAADLDKTLAEVDLQLSTRWRLEPRRRQCFSLQRLTIGPHGALQRSPADRHTFRGQ
jgi:hypothetical protein